MLDLEYAQTLQELKKIAKGNKKIAAIYLFGSFLKNKNKARDIDLCIISKNMPDMQMAKISMCFQKPIDISFMQKMPPYVAIRVLNEGEAVFIQDEKTLSEIWLSVVRPYLSYQPMREKIYSGVKTWMNLQNSQTA